MKQRRILFIHHTMGGGGAERALLEFLKHYDRSRWTVTLLLLAGGRLMQELPHDIEVIQLQSIRGENIFPRFVAWRRAAIALHKLKGRDFDLTVSFLEGPPSILHAHLLRLAPHAAAWVHCDLSSYKWYKWKPKSEKQYYSSLDSCAAVSSQVAASLKMLFDIDSKIVPNPVEATDNYVVKLQHNFKVAFVGRLVEVKRPGLFLETIALLRARGIEANGVVIGDGHLENHLKSLALSLGIGDYIEWAGYSPNRLEIMAECSALCISSQSEGQAIVADEAAAIGLPVISTPVGGVKERLGEWCIPAAGDAVSLAEGLEQVVNKKWIKPMSPYIPPGIEHIDTFLNSIFEKRPATK